MKKLARIVPKAAARFGIIERLRIAADPDWLIRRSRAAYLSNMIDIETKRNAFKASETTRLNENWIATGESINTYLQRDLPKMRNRSRWLLRNMPNAVSAINAYISYCVGGGIRPISTVFDKVKKVDEKTGKDYYEQVDRDLFNEDLDDLWEFWAKNVDITAPENAPESFYDCQELALRKWIEDGEAFIHIINDEANGIVPMSIEFFEPESLDMAMTENRVKGSPGYGNPIVMGVELSKKHNRPVAYWIYKASGSIRYTADKVVHVFKRMRPGQVRGYPWMHSVMEKMFQAEEYEDAELVSSKIASCLSVFFERGPGMSAQGDLLGGTNGSADATDSDGNQISHIQPGLVGSIPSGSNLHVVAPQKPGATYGMHTRHIQHKIASGFEYGLSYEAMTRDLKGVSYAGGRLGTQRAYQAFRQIISFLNRKLNTPLRARWLALAVTSRKIDAPGFFNITPLTRHTKEYWSRHEWIPPAWQYGVNPKDDIAASRDAMRAGISTLDTECSFVGRDWRTTLRIKKKIKETTERYGLTLSSDAEYSVVNGIEPEESGEEDDAKKQPATTEVTD